MFFCAEHCNEHYTSRYSGEKTKTSMKNGTEPEMATENDTNLMEDYEATNSNEQTEFMEQLGLSPSEFPCEQNITHQASPKEATVVKSTTKKAVNRFLLTTDAIHEISKVQSDFTLPYDIWKQFEDGKIIFEPRFESIETNIYPTKVRFQYSVEVCTCRKNDKCGTGCINRSMFYECSASSCPCGDKCENNKIQNQIFPLIERFKTADKGYGMKSITKIPKETYLTEYVGEIVTMKVFEARLQKDYKDSQHYYGMRLEKQYIIDAHCMGNNSRFFNHSCNPNCMVQKWIIKGLPRIILIANRDIEPGEELTFDYKFASKQRQKCLCKSQDCRGFI